MSSLKYTTATFSGKLLSPNSLFVKQKENSNPTLETAIFELEIAQLPGSENLEVGQQVYLSNQYGQPFPVKVIAKEEKTITFDANHEMAGKELNFKIELVEVKE